MLEVRNLVKYYEAGGLFRARIDVPGLPQGIVTHGI